MYPDETVFPTREDCWCVSSPWCSWALHLIRQHLRLGTVVHCRFPTEMLWQLPVWRSLSHSLSYTGSMRWPASCFRNSPMLPELRGDLVPEGSISPCSMAEVHLPRGYKRWTKATEHCKATKSPVMSFSALMGEETALATYLRYFLCYLRAPGESFPSITTCLKKVGESKWTNKKKNKKKRAEEKLCEENCPLPKPSPPCPVSYFELERN